MSAVTVCEEWRFQAVRDLEVAKHLAASGYFDWSAFAKPLRELSPSMLPDDAVLGGLMFHEADGRYPRRSHGAAVPSSGAHVQRRDGVLRGRCLRGHRQLLRHVRARASRLLERQSVTPALQGHRRSPAAR